MLPTQQPSATMERNNYMGGITMIANSAFCKVFFFLKRKNRMPSDAKKTLSVE